MSQCDACLTAVIVNFMNGDHIVLQLSTKETVEHLREKVAHARDVLPSKVAIVAGTVALSNHEIAVTIGSEFSATICNTLGVIWRSITEPSAATWAPLYDFAAVAHENRVLVLGGMPGDCNFGGFVLRRCENRIWATDGGSWEQLPTPPWRPRRSLVACSDADGRLYVFGGQDDRSILYDAWGYKDSAWVRLPDCPWSSKVPDCAAGMKKGAIVIVGTQIFCLTTRWDLHAQMPCSNRATSCAVIGDNLFVGTNAQGCILLCRDGHWSSIKVDISLLGPSYSLVCAGPLGQLFIYLHIAESDGAGILHVLNSEEFADGSSSWSTSELARAIVPRLADIREFHGRSFLLPALGGLGVLSCWGHLMHSS